jgi:hypothetical protein
MPRIGHLEELLHIFGYIKQRPKHELAFDPDHPDKIPSVSRMLLLARESSSEFSLFRPKDLTWWLLRLRGTFLARTMSRMDLYISFNLSTWGIYLPTTRFTSRGCEESPSLHLIVPVIWGIYLHYEKKQGPGRKRPFYVCSVAAVETSGISKVVE